MAMMTMTPAEVHAGIVDCFAAGLVPFVTSSPGMGKSSLAKQIAEEFSLELIDVRLSQCAPEDLMGLPMRVEEDGKIRATFAPFNMFPTDKTPLPKGKNGWLLLFDEFNSASKSVQAAAYRPVLDHEIGQEKLHPQCFVMCAGNLMTDKAIVNSLSTAMQSRVIHMEMENSAKEFLDIAWKKGFDPRIRAFIEFNPAHLSNFKPDHKDRTFACARTWEFASRLIQGKALKDINVKLLGGTIGEAMAVQFHAYLKIYAQLPSYADIIADPVNAPLPTEAGPRFAVVTMLADNFERADFKHLQQYTKRLSPEFQVVFWRGIKRRDQKFTRDPLFVAALKELHAFLKEDDDADLIAVAA